MKLLLLSIFLAFSIIGYAQKNKILPYDQDHYIINDTMPITTPVFGDINRLMIPVNNLSLTGIVRDTNINRGSRVLFFDQSKFINDTEKCIFLCSDTATFPGFRYVLGTGGDIGDESIIRYTSNNHIPFVYWCFGYRVYAKYASLSIIYYAENSEYYLTDSKKKWPTNIVIWKIIPILK